MRERKGKAKERRKVRGKVREGEENAAVFSSILIQ